MNRKNFLSSIVPLTASFSAIASWKKEPGKSLAIFGDDKVAPVPPYLKKGDVIGITCPSGYITLEDIQPAVNKIERVGI